MGRFFFVLFSIPVVAISLFHAQDIVTFAENVEVLQDGQVVQISQEQQEDLQNQLLDLFSNARTMPAFGVMLDSEFDAWLKEDFVIRLTFDRTFEMMDLPFDEICFRVQDNAFGFDLIRGVDGVHEGRCIHLECESTHQFFTFLQSLDEQSAETKQPADTKDLNEKSAVTEQPAETKIPNEQLAKVDRIFL